MPEDSLNVLSPPTRSRSLRDRVGQHFTDDVRPECVQVRVEDTVVWNAPCKRLRLQFECRVNEADSLFGGQLRDLRRKVPRNPVREGWVGSLGEPESALKYAPLRGEIKEPGLRTERPPTIFSVPRQRVPDFSLECLPTAHRGNRRESIRPWN